MKKYVAGIMLALIISGIAAIVFTFPNQLRSSLSTLLNAAAQQFAAVILAHNPRSIADLQSDYNTATTSLIAGIFGVSPTKVRILLVPGHEPDYGGAEYRNLKERDMTVELADDLENLLNNNPHYQVFITRDAQAWNPIFTDYFKNNWNDILAWDKASQAEFSHLISIGSTTEDVPTIYHNTAPENVALRLYGITKWADENDIDITIHIHFNDNDRRNTSKPGIYSGFAIYVPATQYSNSSTTKAVADSIFKQLASVSKISNLPGESSGIVDEPDLIAIGANNTADAASMLIEYGYIYEPQFQAAASRAAAIASLAQQTYLGLQDFFEPAQ